MGGVGSMYGEDDSCIQAFGGGKPEKKRQLEDPGVDGKKISSSSYICHGVGPLVDPFRSHVSRSLFKGLP